MIVFDLRCGNAHVFEAWFASSAAFDDQCARSLLSCPVCGDGSISKAVMAPNIGAKSNALSLRPAPSVPSDAPTPAAIKAAMQALAAAQAQVLEKSVWVGRAFADQARAMHDGEREAAPIHGQTTLAEAKALVEDGVPIAALPFPIVPPEAIN